MSILQVTAAASAAPATDKVYKVRRACLAACTLMYMRVAAAMLEGTSVCVGCGVSMGDALPGKNVGHGKAACQYADSPAPAFVLSQTPHALQVNLPKPIGVRFGRGNDGAAYVLKSDDALGNTDERIEVCGTFSPSASSFAVHHWDATWHQCVDSSM